MRTKASITVLALLGLVLTPALAQQGPPQDVARVYQVEVKSGHAAQFEEAYKQHLAWHKQQNDKWEWSAWQFVTGEDFGQYIIRTGNHTWADFDSRGEMGSADEADAMQRLTPHMEETESWFSQGLLEISHWPDMKPPAMIVVTQYHLSPGADQDWLLAVRKFHEALQKANAPFQYYFVRTVAGGEMPTYAIISPRENWAAMNPPEKSFLEIAEGVMGRQETADLLKKFNQAVHCTRSNVLRYRADLSYTPPSM